MNIPKTQKKTHWNLYDQDHDGFGGEEGGGGGEWLYDAKELSYTIVTLE